MQARIEFPTFITLHQPHVDGQPRELVINTEHIVAIEETGPTRAIETVSRERYQVIETAEEIVGLAYAQIMQIGYAIEAGAGEAATEEAADAEAGEEV